MLSVETVNPPQETQIECPSGESIQGRNGAPASGPDASCATGPSDCNACGRRHGGADASPPSQLMTGWRFVWTSVGVFLVPLALAVAGACWFRNDPARQVAAGLGGLCLGMALAGAAARLLQEKGSGLTPFHKDDTTRK
jgi:hypothetical protein